MKSGKNIAFNKMKKGDVFAAVFVLLIAAVMFFFLTVPKGGKIVTLRYDGKVAVYSLGEDREIDVENESYKLKIIISDGCVYVKETNCPDELCRKTGKIKKGSIVCLPAQVVIEVGGGDVDYVAG